MDDDVKTNGTPNPLRTQELEVFYNKLRQGSSVLQSASRRARLHGQPALFGDVIRWYRSLKSDFEEILELSKYMDSLSPNNSDRQAHGVTTCPLGERVTILERLVEELYQRALFVGQSKKKTSSQGGTDRNGSTDPLIATDVEIDLSFPDLVSSLSSDTDRRRKRAPQRPDTWKRDGKGKIIFCQCCHERKRGRVNNLCNTCETVWYRHRTESTEHIPECTGLMRPQDPQCKTCVINKIKALKLKPVPENNIKNEIDISGQSNVIVAFPFVPQS